MGIFPFTTRRSHLTTDMVSTNRNWERVCIFLCQETALKSYHWGCSFSFFLPRFNLKLSPNTTSFDTSNTPIPVTSLSTIFEVSFFSTHGILRVHSDSGNFFFQGFLSSSSFPVSTSARDFTIGSMSSPIGATSRLRVVVGLTSALLCHPRFPTVESPSQNTGRHRSPCWFLQTSISRFR